METTISSSPQQDLSSLVYEPSFEPDYNNLVAQPWVEPVSQAQSDDVDVYADRLEFPDSHPDIESWAPGRLVVGGASQGAGMNGMGFARRVVSVKHEGRKYVVMTSIPAIEDIAQGDVQVRMNPADTQELDLTKVDPAWVAANLYFNSEQPVALPISRLSSDYAAGTEPLLWPFDGSDIGAAAQALAQSIKDAYVAITPATVSGSLSLTDSLTFSKSESLFDFSYGKKFNSKKGFGIEAQIAGNGEYAADVTFNPGLQFGASLAVPGHDASSSYWLNVDSRLQTKLALDVALEASLTSVEGEEGEEGEDQEDGEDLEKSLNESAEKAQDILSSAREHYFGDPDMKPAGGWKKTLVVTTPRVATFMAGPVPVVVTSTVQLDLECGFEAKASVKSHLELSTASTFKFKVSYDSARKATATEGPTFDSVFNHDLQVTGEGELSVTCGLIPRINAFLYDSVGLNAGVRASLVGRGQYESSCKSDPNDSRPTGELTLGLYANAGVQAGARIQAPGSSFAGTAGLGAGFDIGPVEVWNRENAIVEKSWEFADGFGYCTPLCKNGGLDGDETDVDCGGSCGRCALGKSCTKTSDCNGAYCSKSICSTDSCFDGAMDGAEVDVDCGGDCAQKCGALMACRGGADCESGYCKSAAGTYSGRREDRASTCADDHCEDRVRDADETGVDCGGQECGACANGVLSSSAAGCTSGFWNGHICVATACEDGLVSGTETGVDCGGPDCAAKCGFSEGCRRSSDCAAGSCDPATHLCTRVDGEACNPERPEECSGGVCTTMWKGNGKVVDGTYRCASPTCTDKIADGNESDVDCGGSCDPCLEQSSCSVASDCASRVCAAGKCVGAACADGVLNGSETDLDCGGSCGPCGSNQACLLGSDCTSTFCVAGKCTVCSGECPAGSYLTAACTAVSDRVCEECSGACTGGAFESMACSSTADRACSECSGVCPGGFYRAAACSEKADRTCAPCSGVCAKGSYESAACSPLADRVCTTDADPPQPGNALTFTSGFSAMNVTWGEATDVPTPQEELRYKLVKSAVADSIATATAADALAGSSVVMDYTANVTSFTAVDLPSNTPMYFAVVVKDVAGNLGLYGPTSTSTTSSKLLFATDATTTGNIGGIAGADQRCMTDSNYPGVGTFKAFLVGDTRTACVSPNCSSGGAAEHSDWVLTPLTAYRNSAGEVIGTTSDLALFAFPLEHAFEPSRAAFPGMVFFSGMSESWQTMGGLICASGAGAWTEDRDSPVDQGPEIPGASVGTMNIATPQAIGSSLQPCYLSYSIVCVEQ